MLQNVAIQAKLTLRVMLKININISDDISHLRTENTNQRPSMYSSRGKNEEFFQAQRMLQFEVCHEMGLKLRARLKLIIVFLMLWDI